MQLKLLFNVQLPQKSLTVVLFANGGHPVLEGRNFHPRALRSEMLRSAKFYCHISLEDQNTHEVLYSAKTRKAQKDPNHSISWAEDVFW